MLQGYSACQTALARTGRLLPRLTSSRNTLQGPALGKSVPLRPRFAGVMPTGAAATPGPGVPDSKAPETPGMADAGSLGPSRMATTGEGPPHGQAWEGTLTGRNTWGTQGSSHPLGRQQPWPTRAAPQRFRSLTQERRFGPHCRQDTISQSGPREFRLEGQGDRGSPHSPPPSEPPQCEQTHPCAVTSDLHLRARH